VRPEAARSLARRCSNTRKGGQAPLPSTNGYRFFAVRLFAGLRAAVFLAADFLAAVFLRVVFLRVVFLAAGLRAAVFLRVVFLRAGLRAAVFLAAGFLRVVFLRVAFFAAVLRFAVVRFLVAADFLAAVERLALFRFLVAAAFFPAVDLFFAGDIGHPLPSVSGRHALQASPFSFAHPSPYPVPLIAAKGIVEALDANRTIGADPLGLSG
jgi:hypothetical protein